MKHSKCYVFEAKDD
ncbi:TPA: hypothetical protein ACS6DA_004435 [Salmonella enterica subsp. enterica]